MPETISVSSQIKLPANIQNLQQFINFVSDNARQQGFDQKRIKEIELATEETIVNILNYAYRDVIGDIEITCKTENNEKFIIEIIDSGIPFNPLSVEEPDIYGEISEREVGGLGVFLMRKLMDDVHYRRDENKNILTLIVSKMYIGKENR
jgi:serine/threonine-protein kinase RsbW